MFISVNYFSVSELVKYKVVTNLQYVWLVIMVNKRFL